MHFIQRVQCVFFLGVMAPSVFALDRSLSTVTVSNTNVATSIYSITIPANLLGVNRGLRVKVWGTYLNNSGATTNLTITINFGGAALMTKTFNNVATSATTGNFYLQTVVFNANATNAQRGAYNFYAERAGAVMAQLVQSTAAGAVDTTVAQAFDVRVTHSVANLNISLVKQGAIVLFE